MSMRTRIFVLALLLLAPVTSRAEIKPGDRAIDFEKRTPSGDTLKLSSLRGKVVLLDFWASWCEPCKKELPILARMAPRLRARGVEIVTVNIDERPENAAAFLKSHDLRLTVVLDSTQNVVNSWEPPNMPTSFVVDRGGVVRAVNAGFDEGDESKLEKELVSLATR
jgi:peroxiredoxin